MVLKIKFKRTVMNLSKLLQKLTSFISEADMAAVENSEQLLAELVVKRDAIVAEIEAYIAEDIDVSILEFKAVKHQYDALIQQFLEKRNLLEEGLSNMQSLDKYYK